MIASLVHAVLIWLCLILLMFWLSRPLGLSRPARLAVAVVSAMVVGLVPLPILGSVYLTLAGGLWPLSAGLAIGLAGEFATRLAGRPIFAERDRIAFGASIVLCGFLVIPGALYHFLPDIYALGFQGPVVPGFMAAMLLLALVLKSWLIVLWIGVASIWSLAGINPGLNLWDSLVDPVVFLGSLAFLLLSAGRKVIGR
jgi:hypothetical protein